MTTVKLGTQVRQEQIARAALGLLATHGLQGLNIKRVAQRIGMVPSAIYRHFKSKEEILDAVLGLIEERLVGNVQAVCEESADSLERLRLLLMHHIQLIRENEAVPRVVFSEEVGFGDPAKKSRLYGIISRYLQEVEEILRRGQKEGAIRAELDPATVAVMFLGLIQPAAILWHVSSGRFDVTRQASKAWEIFREAIRTR
ncbi:TetR/AcrR family transcriptional regulator [Desulfoferrobacter suflitae]|uniref:TetR/AcrR family transcriptional regulator n=1 Tax=Desulfoferrobacter suflitae TaxID=2865782 RepID=UPI0021648693|nr:TetR/AcrR family transcriptional regulator [Desulfoferrobacter suflitae]MCK8604304.1 TetR/AcrR family transcriptional regulator [Desulfoferrobacter suflitae]